MDYIIDFETLSTQMPRPMVVELSIIPFDAFDYANIPKFDDLVKKGMLIKFDLNSQKGKRHVSRSTLEWWKKRPQIVQDQLKKSEFDVSIKQGVDDIIEFINKHGYDKNTQIWCRGCSFDISIFKYLFEEVGIPYPFEYYNERDIRTGIETFLGVRGQKNCPIKLGVLDGFIKHNSIHDCAKDIIMLMTSASYSYALTDFPIEEEIDPLSMDFVG